jgi:sialic acid synthase SpsE
MLMLVRECGAAGIAPLFTCWDIVRAGWCKEAGLNAIKIASFHITDIPLLRFIGSNFGTVFMSTGMSDMKEVKRAVSELKDVRDLYLLHCVSDYPARYEDINLRFMEELRRFGARVGYSDHTLGITACVAAAAMGADVIEKHFTLRKDLPGTDHVFSATPDEFKLMADHIRITEKILGVAEKISTRSELKNRRFLRERFNH